MEGGHWRVVAGPPDMGAALNATRPDIASDDDNPDLTVARAAERLLYPGCEVGIFASPRPTARRKDELLARSTG